MFIKKTSLVKSTIFLIIFFLINSLLSQVYLSLDNKTILARSHQQFEAYQGELKYLFIGDSHTQDALDPQIIDHSFNYATIGENYILNYYKLKYVLEKDQRAKSIKTVVLPLELHSFSSFGLNRLHNKHFWSNYIDFIELGKIQNKLLYYSVQKWRGKIFPYELQGIADSAQLVLKPNQEVRQLFNGFASNDQSFADFSETEKQLLSQQRAQTFHQNQEALDPSAVYYFKKIIELCLKHKIKLLLVKFPISQEYYEAASLLMDIEAYYQEINTFIPPTKQIKLLDYQQYFFDDDQYLGDPDHLNKKGAKIISNLIKQEL